MPLHRITHPLKPLWYSVTEPSSTVRGKEQRRQARLFASLLIAIILLGFASNVVWLVSEVEGPNPSQHQKLFLNLGMDALLLIPYWLSRTRRYILGFKLFVGLTSLTIFLVAIPTNSASELYILDYLVVSLFLCSLFLSLQMTGVLLAAHLIGIAIFGLVVNFPGLTRGQVFFGPLLFNALASCAILLVVHHRNWLEQERQSALRESERKYRLVIEQASDGIGVVDQQGHFLELNSALSQMLGYSQEEILGLRVRDVVVQADLATALAQLDQLSLTGTALTTLEVRRKDGTHLPVEVSSKQLEDGRIQAFVRDITARRQAEEALRLSEQRFSRAFQASPLPTCITTLHEQRLIDANESFFHFFGFSKEEVLGRIVTELGATLTFLDKASVAQKMAADQPLRNIEAVVSTISGDTRNVLLSIEFIDLNGQQCALSIFQDITERKRAEEALSQERSLLRTLIDNLPDYIFIKDAEGRFLISNTAHSRAAQRTIAGSPVGRTASDLFPPDFAKQYQADDQAVLQSGQALINVERITIGEDGNPRWVLTTKVPLRDSTGKITGLVGISRDITERKRAEDRFRSLLESAPDAMVIANGNGEIVLVNSRAELIGQRVEVLIPEALRNQHRVKRTAYNADPHAFMLGSGLDLFALRKDGGQFPVEVSLSPIVTEEGTLLVSAIRDITGRKQAEEALRKAQEAEHEQRVLAEALRDTAAALTSALNPDVVMQRILENLGRVVAHEAVNIMLIEGDSARIAYRRGYPSLDENGQQPEVVPLNVANLREMIISSAPCLIPDVTVYPGWAAIPGTAWIRSYLGAPLRVHGSTLGFINLDSATPNFFNHVHAERLQAFADQAAIAIENAQLYNELLHHATKLELHVAERTAELSHAKERVEAILSNSSDAVAVLELDGTISQTNPAFRAMFGHQAHDLSLPLLAEPDSRQKFSEAIQSVLGNGQPARLEISARNQWGNVFSADVALSPIRRQDVGPASKALSGVVCSIRDMTERRRAEEALAQERNLLRTVIDNVPDFIYVKDAEHRFVLSNASVAKFWATTPDEIVGKTDFDLFPEDLAAHFRDDERLIIETAQPLTHEEMVVDPAGRRRVFLTTKVPLFDKDLHVIGLVGTSRDITESKQIEKELQELNRLKTEFLSTAAHELRTPLTSIRGFSEILLARSFGEERQRRYLSLINEQAAQLGKLIDDLLDITRLETRRSLALELGPVDLAQLLDKAVTTFAEFAPRHQIKMEGLSHYPAVKGDAFRLTQVINNLLSNAVKYSPRGGVVTIRTRLLADSVELCVQDEGIGMTAEQQAHLFEKFYRADASNTTISGTGLGLSICKLIVELHGGRIWVDSEYGVGTKLYVTLPLATNC